MRKINKHIVIVRTETVRQSSMGHKSGRMIHDVLSRYYDNVSVALVSNEQDLQEIIDRRPDLVFLGLKRTSPTFVSENYTDGDDIWVSEYFAHQGINHTGSSKAAIALDLNKNLAKATVHKAGLATAMYFMAEVDQYTSAAELPIPFPLFIKPPTQGGGKGVAADSIARNFSDYQQKVAQIYTQFGTPALVETYLTGREFSVALLGEGSDVTVMPVELIADANDKGDRILGAAIKSADTERLIAVPDGTVRTELIRLARAVYQAIGARDYGRIDIRMDEYGQAHFLEANLVPGLANNDFISYFTHACMLNEQLDYEAMILKIVEISLARSDVEDEDEIPGDYRYTLPVFPLLRPS